MRLGWYCYLEQTLEFPFEAMWNTGKHAQQPVEVLGMADEDDCTTDMLVTVKCQEGTLADELGVPLTKISALAENSTRKNAIEDWQYWLNQGGELIAPDEWEEY